MSIADARRDHAKPQRVARAMLREATPEIMAAIIARAKGGDPAAQRLCAERILPTLLEQNRIEQSKLTAEMLADFLQLVIEAVASTPDLTANQILSLRNSLERLLPKFTGALAVTAITVESDKYFYLPDEVE